MPFYDFKCKTCSHVELDKLTKMDQTTMECPECKDEMVRMIGAPNFKMGKSFFVKPPSKAEQKSSEWIMEDYKKRARGELQ